MKLRENFDIAIEKIDKAIHFVTNESVDRIGGFLRGITDVNPFGNILENTENLIEKVFISFEKWSGGGINKQPENLVSKDKDIENQPPSPFEGIFVPKDEPKELDRETFIDRLEELRSIQINEMTQQNELEQQS